MFWRTLSDRLPDNTVVAVAFYTSVAAYAGWIVLTAGRYSADARLFPRIVGVCVLGLVAVRATLPWLLAARNLRAGGLFDGLRAEHAGVETARRRSVGRPFAWLGVLLVVFWLFGPLVAAVVVTAGYVAVERRSYWTALVLAAAVALAVYVLFVIVLRLPPYDPFVYEVVGR